MPKIEIELDDQTYESVQRHAAAGGRSLSATVQALLRTLFGVPRKPESRTVSDFSFIGAGRSGHPGRVSEEHDTVLGETRW